MRKELAHTTRRSPSSMTQSNTTVAVPRTKPTIGILSWLSRVAGLGSTTNVYTLNLWVLFRCLSGVCLCCLALGEILSRNLVGGGLSMKRHRMKNRRFASHCSGISRRRSTTCMAFCVFVVLMKGLNNFWWNNKVWYRRWRSPPSPLYRLMYDYPIVH